MTLLQGQIFQVAQKLHPSHLLGKRYADQLRFHPENRQCFLLENLSSHRGKCMQFSSRRSTTICPTSSEIRKNHIWRYWGEKWRFCLRIEWTGKERQFRRSSTAFTGRNKRAEESWTCEYNNRFFLDWCSMVNFQCRIFLFCFGQKLYNGLI